jgi:hypothetical protein
MIAKPISIKDAKRKFGGCAQKAVELTSGDPLQVAETRLGDEAIHSEFCSGSQQRV